MNRAGTKVLTILCCLLAFVPSAAADAIREASFELNTGARQDRLIWNTYYSELDWDDLDIYEIGGYGRLVVENDAMPFATCIRIRGVYGS